MWHRYIVREMGIARWVLTMIVTVTVILGIYRHFSGPDLREYMAPPPD
jgi:hypothetical protein